MTAFSRLVVGCSKQLPNDLLAYRLVGSSAGGRVMLSRRGVSYSADPRELSERIITRLESGYEPPALTRVVELGAAAGFHFADRRWRVRWFDKDDCETPLPTRPPAR